MKSTGFIWKGIRHYRSAYWGVLAGSAVGAMVLLGALMAGDSVQESLTKSEELRTGKVSRIFSGGERFFCDDLAGRKTPTRIKPKPERGGREQGPQVITQTETQE